MNKYRRIAFYCMIPIVIICIIEGYYYYWETNLSRFGSLLATLDNTVKLFIARPNITSVMALEKINETYSVPDALITYSYSVIVFIGPVLTATALISGFKAYIFDFMHSVKISLKEKMFIIGDGSLSGPIARKYSDKFYVQYMMPSETENESRVPLLKKKVNAYTVDYKNISPSYRAAKIENAGCIVLNFKDWFDSYSTVIGLIQYMITESDTVPTPVYFVDAPSVFVDLFNILYRAMCRKNGKPESVLSIRFVNINTINAKNFFKDPRLLPQPGRKHHIIFTGLGKYGQAFLMELGRYMKENGLTGTVDIFDRNIDQKISDFVFSSDVMRRADNVNVIETAENAFYSTEADTAAGPIRFNFYQTFVGNLDYVKSIGDIINQDTITEFFVCVDDISTGFECYRMLLSYGETLGETKIYFRAGPDISRDLKEIEVNSIKVDYLPDGLPEMELFEESRKSNHSFYG